MGKWNCTLVKRESSVHQIVIRRLERELRGNKGWGGLSESDYEENKDYG